MATETGTIEKILSRKALVLINKSSACASCESHASCQIISDGGILVKAANDLNAVVGDHVELTMPDNTLMRLSLLIYFFPIVALVVGACTGGALADYFHLKPTPGAMLGGALFMGCTFYILRRLDRKAENKSKYSPHITRIISSEESPPQPDDSK